MHILFDLDGTLTDSEPGIINSAQHALAAFGIRIDPAELRSFIGPPLINSFRDTAGLDEADARRAIAIYREYFSVQGLYENALYPGVPDLLAALREAGNTLAVATSKPEIFARRIIDHFRIAPFFEAVCGADLEGLRSEKPDVIRYALDRLHHPAKVIMVGDRKHDIIGAHENGLDAVGVLYGYGTRAELEQAGASRFAATVPELETLLLALGASGGEEKNIIR